MSVKKFLTNGICPQDDSAGDWLSEDGSELDSATNRERGWLLFCLIYMWGTKQSLVLNYPNTCLEVQLETVMLAGYLSASELVAWVVVLYCWNCMNLPDILTFSHAYLFKKRSRESK